MNQVFKGTDDLPPQLLRTDVTGFSVNVHLRRRGRPAQLSVRAKEEATRLLLTLIRQGLQDRDGLLSQPEHMREHKHMYTYFIVGLPACQHTNRRVQWTQVSHREALGTARPGSIMNCTLSILNSVCVQFLQPECSE